MIDAAPSESDFSDSHEQQQQRQQHPPTSATSSVVGGVGLGNGEGGGSGGDSDGGGDGNGVQPAPWLLGGGVGGSGGGVAIPVEEYVQLIARPGTAGSSTDRADTPRPLRAEPPECEQQPARRPEWGKQAVRTHEWEEQDRLSGAQTPATDILSFEDARESFHTPGETTPPTAVVGIAA